MKKLAVFLSLLVLISFSLFAVTQHLTILHVNDTHGHAWAFGSGQVGGFAAVSWIVDEIRAEVEACGGNVLVLHAGDINTGVPESDQLDAIPDIVAMNMIGFDAFVLGNHEFDKSRDVLMNQIDFLEMPVLSANILDEEGNPYFTPYVILELGGVNVAIFGLTTEYTVYAEPIYLDGLTFENVIETTKKLLPDLQEQADVIIALTHLGYGETLFDETTSDMLAQAVDGIDVIVDGHSHTLFEEAPVYGETILVQAGDWNRYVGRLDLTLVDGDVVDFSWTAIPVTPENYPQDPKVAAALDYFWKLGGEKLNVVVGKTAIPLNGERADVRSKNTNLSNLITDAMVWKSGADIAIANGGGIRASIGEGDITYRDVLTVLPFGNVLYEFTLRGEEVMGILEYAATIPDGAGAWMQSSGLSYTYENGAFKDVLVQGEPIEMDKMYKLATNDYMAGGGDGYTMLPTYKARGYDTGFVLADVVKQYLEKLGTIESYDDSQRTIYK
ncbi:MAG TPA: 5'-nucleotidase C-terminal domain-containing protein [Thermotogota bacterium]|nr:5'-nucleotidase C-terminal domain-containing protein [Thermotogota bacterium]HRW93269.1 5'-nucleotidase C-terminal domain-containing protein [Thermotogota bacterium]